MRHRFFFNLNFHALISLPRVSTVFPILLPEQASGFARLGLANVRREFPHSLQHMLNGPEDAKLPRVLHPAFYGSSTGILPCTNMVCWFVSPGCFQNYLNER